MLDTIPAPVPAPEAPAAPPAERHPTRRILIILAVLLTLSVVGGLAYYGYEQNTRATKLDTDLSSTKAALTKSQRTLETTQSDLSDTQSDLSSAEQRLTVCSDVVRTANELFDANGSLLDALNASPFGATYIEDATDNLQTVQDLINSYGYSGLQEFLDACSEGDTGTTT